MRALSLLCALVAQPLDKYTLEFYEDTFVVRGSQAVTRIPLVPEVPKPRPSIAYRRNQNFAVWDERGLTVRRGDRVLSQKLGDIATSPKVLEREELVRTVALLRSGQRKRDPAGISGSLRVGTDVFFLVRWEEAGGKPWLEALVRVDLTGTSLKGELVGRFAGLSLGSNRIDDELRIVAGKVAVVARQEATWGLATFDPTTKEFAFETWGARLGEFIPIPGSAAGMFTEATTYGTNVAGRVDLTTGTREAWAESRSRMRFLEPLTLTPPVVLLADRDLALRQTETGAEIEFPAGWSFRSVEKRLVLAFSPEKPPREARLLDARAGWEELARWSAPR